jgi:Lon protease-like protein
MPPGLEFDAVSDALDLGLFPLDLVLVPGERLPLHLFEPRYRQLYADCVLDDRPFVIVRAGPTGTADVGCSARFETLVRRFDDGRLDVVVQGVQPVRLVEETEGRLYFSARVEPLEDDAPEAPTELADGVLRRFRALAGLKEGARPEAPEGVPLSYAIAATLDLAPGPKQRLLESRDESERLALLTEMLEDVGREVRHARLAAERAATNGKVSTP